MNRFIVAVQEDHVEWVGEVFYPLETDLDKEEVEGVIRRYVESKPYEKLYIGFPFMNWSISIFDLVRVYPFSRDSDGSAVAMPRILTVEEWFKEHHTTPGRECSPGESNDSCGD